MKWIGQHIYDQISRFRNDVFIEDSDLTIYKPINDDPVVINLGSSATERLEITANYASGTQQVNNATFTTYTESTTGNRGRFNFSVDETTIAAIMDYGINLAANKGIAINATDIITDSSGTATLSNIDALDATTIATFETAMEANLDTLSNVTSVGTLGALAITSASDLGAPAMVLHNQDADQMALDINASNTTAHIVNIACNPLTSGSAINIDSDACRNEFYIDRNCTKTVDVAHSGMIYLRGVKAGITVGGDTHNMLGLQSTITDTTTNVGTSNLTNLKLSSNMTNAGGTTKLHGIANTVTGASDDTVGLYSNVVDGSPDIKLVSSADKGDFCTIATTTHGATTITTEDDDATAAHFEIAADGNITLDAAADIAIEAGSGVVMMAGLPTSDPSNAGQLWNDSNTLKISAG